MNILNLLNALEEELNGGKGLPFANKVIIDKERCLEIIDEIKLSMPEDIKQAEWLNTERQKLIADANNEYRRIIKEAEARADALVLESEITQRAVVQSKNLMEVSENNAREIRLGSKEYADYLLSDIEKFLLKQVEVLRENRQELKNIR